MQKNTKPKTKPQNTKENVTEQESRIVELLEILVDEVRKLKKNNITAEELFGK
jgi:hypothetical protein